MLMLNIAHTWSIREEKAGLSVCGGAAARVRGEGRTVMDEGVASLVTLAAS